jgi:carnitine 3-dehydrogenase
MSWRGAESVRSVAVIGSGVIGAGWVAAYLGSGRRVRVFDPVPEAEGRVKEHIAHAWPGMAELGLVASDADPDAVSFHQTLAEAVEGADLIQENTPERTDVKSALFEQLDRLLPEDVMVASSTSSLPITDLAQGCSAGARFVLGHPFNPVHLMPLVEVGGGDRTDPAAIDTLQSLYASMGKAPVRLRREIFGHVANRLASAMFREAVSLVETGAASVEDVDRAIRFGPALKWAIQGQFATFHTSGGAGGLEEFLPKFAPGIIKRWRTMADPDLAGPAVQAKLVAGMAAASHGRTVEDYARRQDAMLTRMLGLLGSE